MKRNIIYDIISALISGTLFIVTLIIMNSILISLVLSVLCYIGLYLLIVPKSPYKNISDEDIELIERVTKEGLENIKEIRTASEKVNFDINRKIKNICDISEKIIENIKKEPQSIHTVKKLLTYYLPAVSNIIDIYIMLKKQDLQSKETQDRLKKVEDSLNTMEQVFNNYLTKSLEGKISELDYQLELLNATIELDE